MRKIVAGTRFFLTLNLPLDLLFFHLCLLKSLILILGTTLRMSEKVEEGAGVTPFLINLFFSRNAFFFSKAFRLHLFLFVE